ncbi:hypothetical protein PPYR_00920 [Photinus pyralis]|uniref:Peptidase M13 N-terminal domain-containing protein n=1 Tax=Photinus pyralis TaxID=7054 RepID=A0A5N4B3J7_PHOPY|nr:neprilysin-2-like [Photinus pyralis]KAB0803950.1 hypothetical protein PPYR_00920 [Photinus pyralis]
MAEGISDKKPKRTVQCNWGEKSKLERNLIITLIVIILLFIGILLYVVIRPAVMRRTCMSKDCLISASEIISRIRPEIDPCDDVVKFACANSKGRSDSSVKDGIERDLLEILQSEVGDNDHILLKVEKLLFQACLKDGDNNLTLIDNGISDLGWPVLIGYQWRDQNFDWQQLIFKLRKNGYPFEMMLQVQVVKEGPMYTVKVSPPSVTSVTAGVELYKKYMADVAVFFGAEAKRAENEMEKVFYFAQHLKKISDSHSGSVSTTIRNYLEDNADIDWLNYINNILYPVNQLSLDDYAQFPTKEFIDELHNLIYRTPKRTLANYIIWSALEISMPFMPQRLRELRLPYECHTKSDPIPRELLCRQVLRSFVPDPAHIEYARMHLSKVCRTKVTKLYHSVQDELIKAINETCWLDGASRNHSINILSGLNPIIGIVSDYFSDSIFGKDSWPGYHGNVPQNATFFQMVLAESYRYQNNQFHKVRKGGTQDAHAPVTSTLLNVDLESNTITLPIGILRKEMFSEDRPMYLNYGLLGRVIAVQLSKVMIEMGVDIDENYVWTATARDQFFEKAKCLVDAPGETLNNTLANLSAEYFGTQVAYSAYKKWSKQNTRETLLPGLSYDPHQVFWISSIHCSTPTLLQSNNDFTKDFNCPTNPSSKKCKIF